MDPSPAVTEIIRSWPIEKLRLYPDPSSTELCTAIADFHGVGIDQVFVGNGSDEVLAHAFCAFFRQDYPILMPDITYAFYRTYCRLYGIDFTEIPLGEDFRIDVHEYAQPCGGVVFANPNAPTGIALANNDVERLLAMQPERVVLVDEAYVDFGSESAIPLLSQHRNLLITRTFSKSRSLAGIRVGYALGSAELIDGLNRVKNSFNSYPLSIISVASAIASLQDQNYFSNTVSDIIRLRDYLTESLRDLGMHVLPSSANFVFAAHSIYSGARLMTDLRQRGVLVRHFDSPRIENFLRITVGSYLDCHTLISIFKKILPNQR